MQSTTAYRPITQTCALTGTPFTITPEDQAFYERIAPVFNGVKYQIPLPTLCPDARQQRRMAWRGKDYFFRPCSKTGKQCLSIYPPDVEMVGYCEEAHEADDWDGTEWGRDIDFTRPFFEQFIELWRSTPKQLSNTYSSDNCSYVINANRNKDCYLVDELDRCRECLYGYCVQDCANVVNGFYARKSNFCYEVSQVEDCYEVFYSHNVHGSSNCAFIKNCRNITNALFCCNLRNKNGDDYYMFNELVSKEAFEEAWNYVFAGKQEHITQSKQRFEQFLQTQTMPAAILTNSEHCIGDQISNSQNCNSCFNIDNCQDCSYCTDIHNSKDVYDCHIYEGEIMIDCLHAGPEGYAQYFSHTPWYSSNVFYCSHLLSCQDCFGCSGMKHKEYCILNKQYSKEEYETLVGKLIEHMQATGEWGEFFSANLSPYGYNQTMASYYLKCIKYCLIFYIIAALLMRRLFDCTFTNK